MTAPAPVASKKLFVGIALESVEGTAITTPTDYLIVTEPPDFDPQVGQLIDTGYRGAPADEFNRMAGNTFTKYGMKGQLFPDLIGYPLAGVLGTEDVTGSGAPYTHVYTAKNSGNFQPPKYTLIDYYVAQCRQIPGFTFDKLTIRWSDGLVEWEATGAGWTSSTLAAPTPSFTTITPLEAWRCVATIAGSATTDVLDGEITISRADVAPVFGSDGTQEVGTMFGGELSVDGSMTLIMENDTEWSRFLNTASTTVQFDWQRGASTALVELKMLLSKAFYTAGKPNRSGKYVTLPVTVKGDHNTTDVGATSGYSPIKVTVKNAKAGGVYV